MPDQSHAFVSYVRENEATVERLCQELRQHGFEVWRDREQIQPGQRWRQAIRQAIEEGAFFLACFSAEYSTRDSTYMNEELTLAVDELRKRQTNRAWFIPVLLNDCHVPDREIGGGERLKDLQWVSLWPDWQEGIRRIVFTMKASDREKPTDVSKQAIFILRQFVESGGDRFFYANWGGGNWSLQLCSGEQNQLEVMEPRFVEDDLNQMVRLGLLTVEYNADGHGIYGITRAATRFIKAIDTKENS